MRRRNKRKKTSKRKVKMQIISYVNIMWLRKFSFLKDVGVTIAEPTINHDALFSFIP